MKKYLIVNRGCDAETAFECELSESELKDFLKIVDKNNETSQYGCMPVILVYDKYETEHNDDEDYFIYYNNKPINDVKKIRWWQKNE